MSGPQSIVVAASPVTVPVIKRPRKLRARDPLSPWLTITDACDLATVGPKLLYREIKAGRLRAARIGGRRDIRIHRDWISAWLEASAEPVEVRR